MKKCEGPRKPQLRPEEQALICEHMELARCLARKRFHRYRKRMPIEDFHGEALLGLTRAARRFDPTRAVPFDLYATKVICRRIRQAFTEWYRQGRLDIPCFTDLACRRTSKDTLSQFDRPSEGAREPWEILADAEMMERLQKELPPRWFRVLVLHYRDGCSLAEIASLLDRSKGCVEKLLAKARKRSSEILRVVSRHP